MLRVHRSVFLLISFFITTTLNNVNGEPNVDSSPVASGSALSRYDQQSDEGKPDENGRQQVVDGLSYFLDNQRSIIGSSSPSSSSSSSSSSLSSTLSPSSLLRSNSDHLYDLYGNRGTSYYQSANDETDEGNNYLVDPDSIIDLPGKRKFIPLRGRKDELPSYYRYYYPRLNSMYSGYNGYRKKAAFTGMRGKKMDSSASLSPLSLTFSNNSSNRKNSNYNGNNRLQSALINRQLYGSMIDLPWINLNDINGFKRSRPFAAMRG